MQPCAQNDSINILGHRQDKVDETELVQLLTKHGITINTVIPSKCTIEQIKEAPRAKLNIVTDMIALDLAKEMKHRFNIDYIYFDKHLNHKIIDENYKQIEGLFGISLQEDLEQVKLEYHKLFNRCQTLLTGKKLIYGNTPMMAFETVDFLSDLGLVPVFVQLRELYDQDIKFKDNLLNKGYDPYISRIANIAPLRKLYGTISADLYVGHESPMLLKQKGMLQITFDVHAQKIGYELSIGMMKDMIKLFEMESMPMGGMTHAAM